MSDKSIIIIGAGIAGLAAGCYGQMNGYQTQIFEMHDLPGGLCTAWKRRGYTFDGCIEWLMGTGEKSPYRQIWDELGALEGKQCVHHDEFTRIVEPDGKTLVVYTNIERLERHLLDLSPQDAGVIHQLTAALRTFARFGPTSAKPRELMTLAEKLKSGVQILPFMPALLKWARVSIGEFAARFQDPFLRRTFPLILGEGDIPMMALLLFLGNMHTRDSGFPLGGSLEFARAIERRYTSLGGKIHYKSRVTRILVENDRAVGICLQDGSEHRADIVVSAADGRTTLFDMLEGKYLTDEIRKYYSEYRIFSPVTQVSLGAARDLSAQPHSTTYVLPRPVTIGGESIPAMNIKHYCFDPSLAPAGRSSVVALFPQKYAYWKEVAQDGERYDAEKQAAATAVIDQLEKIHPGITAQIEVIDVATPLTTERYTGNWQGSIEGWYLDTRHMELVTQGMRKTLPGLANFRMIGQWVVPGGGLPGVAPSGREAIQFLCHEDKKPFVTEAPA